jgi:hypothetical protein
VDQEADMNKDFFANLHERDVAAERTTTGLLSVLPRVPTVTYDDSFCRFVRDTQSIPIDKVLNRFRQGDHDYITTIAEFVDYEFKLDEATDANVLDIVMMYEMMNCGARMESKLARMLWTGNPANNTESGQYREFKGFELQTSNGMNVVLEDVNDRLKSELELRNELSDIKFVIVIHPGLAYSLWMPPATVYTVEDREYRVIFDDAIPEYCEGGEFESSLYIVPLSPEGEEEPVTYLEYTDYRQCIIFPDMGDVIFFWTDNGFYAWVLEQEKWDYKLSIKNESRLVLKSQWPTTRFNVKYRLPT